MEYVACNLCGEDDSEPLWEQAAEGERFQMVRCRHCGLIYLNPRPSEEELAPYYGEGYQPFGKRSSPIMNSWRRAMVRRDIKALSQLDGEGVRVLEIGCATGEYLALLQEESDWEVVGLERSPFAVRQAKERGELIVLEGTVETVKFSEGSFNVVIFRHLLEHLPDPRGFLGEVRRLLKPGGLCLLVVPDMGSWEARLFGASWYDLDPPRHFYHFSTETIRALLRTQKFDICSLSHSYVPNGWIGSISRLLRRRGGPQALVDFLSVDNPWAQTIFAPLGLFMGLIGQSGRVRVIATRSAPS